MTALHRPTAPQAGRRAEQIKRLLPIAFVLLAPSVWLFWTIPPLWRDGDAYFQVTLPFGPWTILHSAPLYCFAARVPLFLGCLSDAFFAGLPLPGYSFFTHPVLTDTGVWLLLLFQHAALFCGALYFVTTVSQRFVVRLGLAALWALNPLFYVFAHCVGSETLSLILILILVTISLKIARQRGVVHWKRWLVFGLLLWLSALTRFNNSLLVVLLPLAFFFSILQHFCLRALSRSPSHRRRHRLLIKDNLGKAALALCIVATSLLATYASLRGAASLAQTEYRSRLGFTFLWRLSFLADLPANKRHALLHRVSNRIASKDGRRVLSLLGRELNGVSRLDVLAFVHSPKLPLGPSNTESARFNDAFNSIARAFLWPPEKLYRQAVYADFRRYGQSTIPGVVSFLFETTAFYFHGSNAAGMAGLAPLVTYRDRDAADIYRLFDRHTYFHLGRYISYNVFLFIWLMILVLFVTVLSRSRLGRRHAGEALLPYSTALSATGLLIVLATCLVGEWLPRYALPMWQLTILSAFALLGALADGIATWVDRTQDRRS